MRRGVSIEKINELTGMDPWFLDNLISIIEFEVEHYKNYPITQPTIKININPF